MALSAEDVKLAYRILLGREASEQEAEGMTKRFPDMASMRRVILVSAEFIKRHNTIVSEFNAQRVKALVQIQIPRTGAGLLAEALAYESALMPNASFHHARLQELKAQPISVRRSYKYIYGDLPVHAGELLEASYRNLIVIRRPVARIFSLYRLIQRDTEHLLHEDVVQSNLGFGEFLELALQKTLLRREIDNGQLRRLADAYDDDSFGHPQDYVRPALLNVMQPDVIFGYSEHLPALVKKLVELKILSSADLVALNGSAHADSLESALGQLSPAQAGLLTEFTQWDEFFYQLCMSIMPSQ